MKNPNALSTFSCSRPVDQFTIAAGDQGKLRWRCHGDWKGQHMGGGGYNDITAASRGETHAVRRGKAASYVNAICCLLMQGTHDALHTHTHSAHTHVRTHTLVSQHATHPHAIPNRPTVWRGFSCVHSHIKGWWRTLSEDAFLPEPTRIWLDPAWDSLTVFHIQDFS